MKGSANGVITAVRQSATKEVFFVGLAIDSHGRSEGNLCVPDRGHACISI